MTTSLSCFPLEVLIIILRYAPDLPSIYRLICASARVNAAFQLSPARILDQVIGRSIPEFNHLARMISIIGTYSATSSHPTFGGLLDKYEYDLPEDVLTTASASFAFATGTPGPRYLVLTAYRIDILQHTCFVYLLQNIHEAMWCIPSTENGEPGFRKIRSRKNNACFLAAAWWSPSWAEKMRITRAYWKLFIFWNIRALLPSLKETNDYLFSRYRNIMRNFSPCLGPILVHEDDWSTHHEIEEMKCVQAATHEFLNYDYPHISCIPFTSRGCPGVRLAKWTFSTTFKEASHWILEDPKPVAETNIGVYNGHSRTSIDKTNSGYRAYYWYCWFDGWRKISKLYRPDDVQFPDYLGLCIWDYKRQGYLGLAFMHPRFFDPLLRPAWASQIHLLKDSFLTDAWVKLFRLEVFRLPGGMSRQISFFLRVHLDQWCQYSGKDDVDLWRWEFASQCGDIWSVMTIRI